MAHVATITIDHTKVSADLTDFVVYVNLNHLPSSFWDLVLNNGGDIRCYKNDGTTELAREVVSCLTADDSGEMYIKYAGTTSASIDTVIQIHADGVSSEPAVTATYGRNAVWTGYDLVMHLSNGTTDSTGNHSPSVTGSVSFGSSYGKIGSGSDTSGGTNDYITTGASFATGNSNKSFSLWFNWDDPATDRGWLLAGGTDVNDQAYGAFVQSVNSLFFHGNGGAADITIDTSISGNTWYHVACSYDTTPINRTYLNGVADTTNTRTLNTGSSTIRLHLRQNGESFSRYDGSLDEVRVRENGTMSAALIATDYANQNSPSTFYTAAAASTFTPVTSWFM